MLTVPNFLDFTINAVLYPTVIRKLCYKMSSIVTLGYTWRPLACYPFININLAAYHLLLYVQAAIPTTAVPTTAIPTAAIPTALVPTAAVPTTAVPTKSEQWRKNEINIAGAR